ncbi:unnamed protein product [Caenorhabditis nigoni]
MLAAIHFIPDKIRFEFEEVPVPLRVPARASQNLAVDPLVVDNDIVPAEAQSSSTEPAQPAVEQQVDAPDTSDPAEATLVAAAPIDVTHVAVAPMNAKEANDEAGDRQVKKNNAGVPQSSSSDVAVPGRRSKRGAAQHARGKIGKIIISDTAMWQADIPLEKFLKLFRTLIF